LADAETTFSGPNHKSSITNLRLPTPESLEALGPCEPVARAGQSKAAGLPPKLDRRRATAVEARAALSESADAIAAVLESASESGGRVPDYPPDAVAFLSAVVTHEAHHRGQIAMLARQLGHPLSPEAMLGMWEPGKRRKETLGGKTG
jgi:uncharacterized damage-inducible protein DinB